MTLSRLFSISKVKTFKKIKLTYQILKSLEKKLHKIEKKLLFKKSKIHLIKVTFKYILLSFSRKGKKI